MIKTPFPVYFTGFADEASPSLDEQVRVTRELGWRAIESRNVQVPGFPTGNLHDIPDPAFSLIVEKLEDAGVHVNSLGTALANGRKDIRAPFDPDQEAAVRAASRAQRLGAQFVRVMSYPIGDPADLHEGERFRRLREFVRIFGDVGVTVVHENCANYGGMSWSHTLRLLENVPGLKLVFDMGNCVKDADHAKPSPHPRQSAWEFFQQVKQHIVYVHIKDGIYDSTTDSVRWCFPGDGQGEIPRILTALLDGGYRGGLSIEPHMSPTESEPGATPQEKRRRLYVAYGRRLMKLVEDIVARQQ